MTKLIEKIKTNKVNNYTSNEENHLSIQLSLDGFSFCIYNEVTQALEAYSTYEIETGGSPYKHLTLLKEIFETDELLEPQYKSVSVSHFNNLVAQVPKAFFNIEELSSYLQYSIKILEDDYITYDEISGTEIINVYIPFVNINNFLLDRFGSFVFKHSSTVFIEKIAQEFKHNDQDTIFVNVYNSSYELLALKGNKLQLFNSFTFNTKEDFIYYILFTAEQLDWNPEEFSLILMGDIEKDSEIYNTVYNYVRNVSFYKNSKGYTLMKDNSAHAHFTLLNS